MPVPLRLPYLERRAKKVHLSRSWRDAIGIPKRPEIAAELAAIRRYITADLDLPDRYYRSNRMTTPDRLLEQDGIMHLHLGRPDTPELLFLVQFPQDVVWLELSNHYHFDLDPPGSVLRRLHEAKLGEWRNSRDAELDALRADVRRRLLTAKESTSVSPSPSRDDQREPQTPASGEEDV